MVHYRTPGLAIDGLRALAPEIASIPGARAIVVENGSGDGSDRVIGEAIRREGWQWASLVVSPTNLGFASGNNIALRQVLAAPDRPEYVHLLNPDTILKPGALRELIAFLDAHPSVGIAGSRLEDLDGTPQASAFRFPSLVSELDSGLRLGIVTRLLSRWIVAPPPRDEEAATDWVCGASMLVRTRIFEEAGLFDERYFLYCEETDFCLQARRAGWTCWYVPSSRVVHLGAQSTGLNETASRMPAYWFESRRHYFRKNHGRTYLWLANLLWIGGYSSWKMRRKLQGKPAADKPRMFSDFVRLSFAAPRGPR
jgi:GT2 family glycosyltransferase